MTEISNPPKGPALRTIRKRIFCSDTGDISYAVYMQEALYGKYGYYTSGQVRIGDSEGNDFATSSGSDAHGMVDGMLAVRHYNRLGRPRRFDLLEIGGGNGTHAAAMLGYIAMADEAMYHRTRLALADVSSALLDRQREALDGHANVDFIEASAATLPFEEGSLRGMAVSSELLDAMPAYCLLRQDSRVYEQRITLNDKGKLMTHTLPVSDYLKTFPESKRVYPASLKPVVPMLHAFAKNMGRILRPGSRLVTYDYGGRDLAVGFAPNFRVYGSGVEKSRSGTAHLEQNLELAGIIDITHNANFTSLKKAGEAAGLRLVSYMRQGRFLRRAGIHQATAILREHHPDTSNEQLLQPITRYGHYKVMVQEKM